MFSKGKDDNTHNIIYGEKTTAKLLSEAIIKEIPELAEYHKD